MIQRYKDILKSMAKDACVTGEKSAEVVSRRFFDPGWTLVSSNVLRASDAAAICHAALNAVATGNESSLDQIIPRQRQDGTFFTPSRGDSPETLWYHELVLLHAIAGFGMRFGHAPSFAAARRAAHYHLHETQPDHATQLPWAVHAFLLDPSTFPLADTLLHTASIQLAARQDELTLLLLADALYCVNVHYGLA